MRGSRNGAVPVACFRRKERFMKNGVFQLAVPAILLSFALIGCQTAKPFSPQNSILTEQTGLSPFGDTTHKTIEFSVFSGDTAAITGWTVEMANGSAIQKRWSGDAKSFPTTLSWDGHTDTGALAPEGTYTAHLAINYGKTGPVTAQSDSFLLDTSAPVGGLTLNPGQFTPDGTGAVQPIAITINGSSAVASMDSWSLEILGPDGRSVKSFDGKWPASAMHWDGKSATGDWVMPSMSYTARLTLRDEFGNTSRKLSTIVVGDLPAVAVLPEAQAAPGIVSVVPETRGFSPNGDDILDALTLHLSYGARASVNAWKVEILDASQQSIKTFNGDGSSRQRSISWDGKNQTGSLAPEGAYTARLSIDYGSAFAPGNATSTPFVLDTTPPTGTVTLSEPLFSPMEGSSTITLSVDASSPVAKIESWKLDIYDPENHLFRTFDSMWPAKTAVWDGKGLQGDLVLSGEDYPVFVTVRDEFGNTGEIQSMVPVDILVEKTLTGFRILSSRIFFKPYTADYTDVSPELAAQNTKRLADLAAKLTKFSNYKINLVGHAVMEDWNDMALGEVEQKNILVPLSKARAEAVKAAMVAQGLKASMFTTQGVGAADQLVPDSNLADRWQNRRVAFFINN